MSLFFVEIIKIHELNREYRGVDRVTDVLSFPLLSDDFEDVELMLEEELRVTYSSILKEPRTEYRVYNHSFEREVCDF